MMADMCFVRNVAGFGLTTANSVAVTKFALNSVYDPLNTGSGDLQPYGYGTLANVYNRYLVKSVRIELQFNNPSTNGIMVGLNVDGASPSGSTADVWLQKPGLTWSELSSGNPQFGFSTTVPVHAVVGLKARQYEDQTDVYGATIGANPTHTELAYVSAVSPSNTQTVNFTLRLVYRVEFFDRLTLATTSVA